MNITDTIDPKVDQLTADHLIGRTMTIRVTRVNLTAGDQPCEIHYEGENGLPYRPGKSMRRVLVHAWGGDANAYVGRSMRLYRDDDVQFGGLKVGGIRISHMSHIESALTMALTAKKGSKKAFKVAPLSADAPKAAEKPKHEAATVAQAPGLPLLIGPDEIVEVAADVWLPQFRDVLSRVPTRAMAGFRAEMGPHLGSIAGQSLEFAAMVRQAETAMDEKAKGFGA